MTNGAPRLMKGFLTDPDSDDKEALELSNGFAPLQQLFAKNVSKPTQLLRTLLTGNTSCQPSALQ